MKPERWQQIDNLWKSALAVEPNQRAIFLEEACGGDEALRREVESLLAYDEKAESFIEAPALDVAAKIVAKDRAESVEGRQLGPYKILSLLGAGGMGQVYLAEDPRLERTIAIKILPAEVSSNPDRMRRFVREAKAASALKHPNVAHIYEIGESEGIRFIAMEYVEGQTLLERIHHRALSTDEILDIAIQTADALDEAHGKGIIHRDIKSSNIMLTTRGQVKVLDFGIAKVTPQERLTGSGDSLTLSKTEVGTLMGTVEYMSPEQALGQGVDRRTDIFSLGVVLYEISTGALPFKGDTATAQIDAILHQQSASPSQVNPKLPIELDPIILRALEKDRELRYQTASDLRSELKRLKRKLEAVRPGETVTTQALTSMSHSRILPRRWPLVAGMLAVLLVGVSVMVWFVSRPSPPPPEPKQRQLTSNPSVNAVEAGVISPDGKHLAYSDQSGLHLKLIETGETRTISPPAGLLPSGTTWSPSAWFPDGTKLLATLEKAAQKPSIWVVSVMTGASHLLREDASDAAVSPDASLIACLTGINYGVGNEVWIMGADGEEPRRLWAADSDHGFLKVRWSPDGQRIAYFKTPQGSPWRIDATLESRDLKGSQPIVIISTPYWRVVGDFWWSVDGRIVYSVPEPLPNQGDSNLWEIRVDGRTGRPATRSRRITNWAGAVIAGLSGTTDGKWLALHKRTHQYDVYLAELEANGTRLKSPRRLTLDDRNDLPTAWTSDSKAVIFVSDRNGRWTVFKQAIDEDSAELITPGVMARISPDGGWILAGVQTNPTEGLSGSSGAQRIMRVPVSGGVPQLVLTTNDAEPECARLPSTLCVLIEGSADGGQHIFTAFDPIQGRGRELARADATNYSWALSPDGSFMALIKDEGHDSRIHFLPLADRKVPDVLIKGWTNLPMMDWSADGKSLFLGHPSARGATLLNVNLEGNVHVLWEMKGLAMSTYGIPSPDGRYLAIVGGTQDSNVWMLENF